VSEPLLLVENKGGIAIVTLNRPEALNALSRALVAAIADAFERLRRDDTVEVVILTGAGRAFSAGVDLKELSATQAPPPPGEGYALADRLKRAFAEFDRPIIGAINGYAITGGFELALMCDLLIASSEARFADTHARVGIAPGWGLSQRLPRLIGVARAKELHFTGNYIDAAMAERWGLVNRVVAPEQLLPTCEALARDMLGCDRRTLRTYKRVVDQGYATNLAEALALEERVSREHMAGVTSQAVASRREDIQQRGRAQQRGEDEGER
jgi:enoyl-CoA hydratase